MKNHKTTAVLLIAAFALALIPGPTGAQRLYNKERDQQAQAALPLSQALKTGELFDRQLRNLASLTKKDFESHFAFTKSSIGTFSLNLLTWNDAHGKVCEVEKRIAGDLPSPEQIATEVKTVKDSIAEAEKSLGKFKKLVKSKGSKDKEEESEDETEKPVLATIFGSLGELEEITRFVDELAAEKSKLVNPQTLETLKEVQAIAAELKGVYDQYKAKVEDFNKLEGQLAELRIVLKKVAIQSLQVDEEHWKNIAAITARREADTANVLGLISQYKGIVRRLRLVKFDEKAEPPKERKFFCDAVKEATNEKLALDINPHQIITDHLWELTVLGQSIDADTRRLEKEAMNALTAMSAASSEKERGAAAQLTLMALSIAINDINVNESTHETAIDIQNSMKIVESNLQSAIRISRSQSLDALRAAIILARTTRRAVRGMVSDIPQVLYILAALSARGSTPALLAQLRFAQELHAYSIRKSAVRARAYELTVSTGAQRLALFHKGGIKPSDIAELVFTASNVAITPAILAR